MCTEIRTQIRIKLPGKICRFLAVKGEHNRILTHMSHTSARSSAGCRQQSVHRSTPTPFHNTQHTHKSSTVSGAIPTNQWQGSKGRRSRRMKCPPLIGCAALVPPAQCFSDRYLGDKQPSATDISDVQPPRLHDDGRPIAASVTQDSPERLRLRTPRAKPAPPPILHRNTLPPRCSLPRIRLP